MNEEFNRKLDNEEEEMALPLHDNEASQEDLNASLARLSLPDEAPESEEDHDTALRMVEHMLMTAPLVRPSVDFAERVIEAIRRQEIDPFNRNSAFGLVLGLGVAAAVVISVLSAFALLLANVLVNWSRAYQLIVQGGGMTIGLFTDTYDQTGELLNDSPVIGLLALASVPLFFVWVWLMRRLKPSEMHA